MKLLKSDSEQEQRKHARALPGLDVHCNFLNSGLSATPRSDIFLAPVELLIIDLSKRKSLFGVAVLLGNKKILLVFFFFFKQHFNRSVKSKRSSLSFKEPSLPKHCSRFIYSRMAGADFWGSSSYGGSIFMGLKHWPETANISKVSICKKGKSLPEHVSSVWPLGNIYMLLSWFMSSKWALCWNALRGRRVGNATWHMLQLIASLQTEG